MKLLKSTLTKPTTRRGQLIKVLAYEHGKPLGEAALLGWGYFIVREDGKSQRPVLYDIAGNELPKGVWYQLKPTDEVRDCIIPRNIQ